MSNIRREINDHYLIVIWNRFSGRWTEPCNQISVRSFQKRMICFDVFYCLKIGINLNWNRSPDPPACVTMPPLNGYEILIENSSPISFWLHRINNEKRSNVNDQRRLCGHNVMAIAFDRSTMINKWAISAMENFRHIHVNGTERTYATQTLQYNTR